MREGLSPQPNLRAPWGHGHRGAGTRECLGGEGDTGLQRHRDMEGQGYRGAGTRECLGTGDSRDTEEDQAILPQTRTSSPARRRRRDGDCRAAGVPLTVWHVAIV